MPVLKCEFECDEGQMKIDVISVDEILLRFLSTYF